MSHLQTAIRIAVRAHEGQLDKNGAPYITHPLRVMDSVEGEAAKCAAVLHDVVEDTSVTLDDLRREGLPEAVLAAVQLVTHRKDQSYADYVISCKADPVARQVKLADLHDNSKLARSLVRPDRMDADLARIHRYLLSYKYLTDQLTESQYRELMETYGKAPAS